MKKKIHLIRLNKTKFGGAENYLHRLSIALDKKNIQYKIINSSMPNFLPSWIKVILFDLQVSITKKNKFYYSLERISCPDLYRAGDGVHKVFLSLEKKSRLNLLHPLYLVLEKKCFNNAKTIIANSMMVKNQIIDTYSIDPDKIELIYNGIELQNSDFTKSFEKISKEFSIIKEQSIILFVGSGFKRKGVKEFLEIISRLKDKNFIAFIVGKDKNKKLYYNLSKQLNIQDKVIFTGPRTDVKDFYSISDIFLFPTHYDPFSNVVLEAMNFENAVFTTSANGASEILNKEYIMHNPLDLNVVSTIDYLLSNKYLLDKIKKRNKKISKLFSIQRNLDLTLKVISQIEK